MIDAPTDEWIERLTKYRNAGVKRIAFGQFHGQVTEVEFFESDGSVDLPKERPVEEKASDDTGLTPTESRALLGMSR